MKSVKSVILYLHSYARALSAIWVREFSEGESVHE